jgi:hypothetical protein
MPTLHEYLTGDYIREATDLELTQSIEASRRDGGSGVIEIDNLSCFVLE